MQVEMVDVVEFREEKSREGCLGGEEAVATWGTPRGHRSGRH